MRGRKDGNKRKSGKSRQKKDIIAREKGIRKEWAKEKRRIEGKESVKGRKRRRKAETGEREKREESRKTGETVRAI